MFKAVIPKPENDVISKFKNPLVCKEHNFLLKIEFLTDVD